MTKLSHEEKLERAEKVNELIRFIGSVGRMFFHKDGNYAYMVLTDTGRVFLIDDYTRKKIYTHYNGKWRNFSHGGTLKLLIINFKNFIIGKSSYLYTGLGPWPDCYCDGDLWGYGKENMELIRRKAVELGICK